MNRRRLLTSSYIQFKLTPIKPIYSDIGARRKRGRYGEDGEEYENKCDGAGDSEVHACVIKTECRCVRLWLLLLDYPPSHTDKL
jgi:hypothetical protein